MKIGTVALAVAWTICTSALSAQRQVNVKLVNDGLTFIPLDVPGIMNANLVPKSESYVTFPVGQKVFYRKKGTATSLLVLEVTEAWPGDTTIVLTRSGLEKRLKEQ